MNQQIFNYTPSAPKLRTSIGDDGQVWFVAADICKILGLANVTKALSMLDDDESTLTTGKGAMGEERDFNVVSESGMYHLIFKSRKDEAKAFRKWVTSEVLPSIRKTGSYASQPAPRHHPQLSPPSSQQTLPWGYKMMGDATISFEGFLIRVVKHEGLSRYVAVDCIYAMGYVGIGGVMHRLDNKYKLLLSHIDMMGRKKVLNTLAKEGALALAEISRMPKAERFYHFMQGVTEEALPLTISDEG